MPIERGPIQDKKIPSNLTRRFSDAKQRIAEAVEIWQSHRNPALAGPVIDACEPLVNYWVHNQKSALSSSFVSVDDLKQEANIGVLRSLELYDKKQASFATYVQYRIRASIQRFIEKSHLLKFRDSNVRKRLMPRYNKRIMQLKGKNPKLTTNELHQILADENDCTVSEVDAMYMEKKGIWGNLDDQTNFEDFSFFPNSYSHSSSCLLEDDTIRGIDRKRLLAYIESLLPSFSAYEQNIITSRIIPTEIETLSSIAINYDISTQAVEQKEKTILKKLILRCKVEFKNLELY